MYMSIKGQATVVKHTGSHYMLSQLPEWNLFPAVLRGKIRLKGSTATNPVAVGDVVTFEADAESLADVSLENAAVITAVNQRNNYIIRKSTNLSRQSHIIAANLDRAFLVITLDFPQVKLPFLDRLLVTCEVYNVPPVIVLNHYNITNRSLIYSSKRTAFFKTYSLCLHRFLTSMRRSPHLFLRSFFSHLFSFMPILYDPAARL